MATVTMFGFTVAGPGATRCNSIHTGIAVLGGASLYLSYTIVKDIHDTPFGGCQNGEGIRVGTPRADSTPEVDHATINYVNVTDYQKNGIVVAGSVSGVSSTGKVTNTTVTGNGKTAVIAQNGIEVVNGAAATISTSAVRDNFYTGTQNVSACGLLIIPGERGEQRQYERLSRQPAQHLRQFEGRNIPRLAKRQTRFGAPLVRNTRDWRAI